MSSVVKKVIAIVVVLAIIAGAVTYKVIDSRVYYNDVVVNGNTVGNLYGNGLFCEHDGVVFFANPNDGFSLYKMNPDESDVVKVCDDRVYFINADSHYIYYSRNNNNDESQMSFLNVNVNSLCRINHNGKKIKILDDAVCSTLSLCQNTLYYHHYDTDDATTMYSIGIDGKDKKQVYKNATDPRCLVGESLFFSGVENDHNIHKTNVTMGAGSSVISDEWAWMPIVDGNYLYILDLNNSYKIAVINLSDGSKRILSQYGASEYNLAGNYIYYQSMKAEKDGIYKINLVTGEEELVSPGQFNSINVTSKYVYFKDFNTEVMMHTSVNGGVTTVFSPLIEIDKYKK